MRSVSESASTASSRSTRHLLSFLLLHAAHADECFFSVFLAAFQKGHDFHCHISSSATAVDTSSVPSAHAEVYSDRRSESLSA